MTTTKEVPPDRGGFHVYGWVWSGGAPHVQRAYASSKDQGTEGSGKGALAREAPKDHQRATRAKARREPAERAVQEAVPEDRIRRQGLAKQFKAARRFRERVGIRKRLMKTVPRGTAGEFIAKQALDDESDCEAVGGRQSTQPTCTTGRGRLHWPGRRLSIPCGREEDYEQPGYDDDPAHRPLLGKGPRSPPGGGEGAKELWCCIGGHHATDPGQWCKPQRDRQGMGTGHAVGSNSGPRRVPNCGWDLDPQFGDRRSCIEI